jgi:hypothetical protein
MLNGSDQPRGAVRLRLEGGIFREVEDWRRSQPKIPSRAKAVRLLIERALAALPDGPGPPEMRRQRTTHITTNSQKFETVRPPSSA